VDTLPPAWSHESAFYPTQASFDAGGAGVYEYVMDIMEDPAVVRRKFLQLQREGWVDEATKEITVSFVMYNAEQTTGWFARVLLTFQMGKGGFTKKLINVVTAPADAYFHLETCLVDVFFVYFLARMLIKEVSRCRELIAKDRILAYFRYDNMVDFSCLALSGGSFVLWMLQTQFGLSARETLLTVEETERDLFYGGTDIGSFLNVTNGTRGISRFGEPEVVDLYQQVFTHVDNIFTMNRYMKYCMFFYSFALIFRFFKAFAAQPRLAVVAETLSSAQTDIIHLFIVLSTIIFAFVLAALIMFGGNLKEYSSITLSLMSSFEILLGAFDFDSMFKVNWVGAMVWFISYQTILVLVLMNMVLAIVMDAYTEVKASKAGAQEMWMQAMELVRRHRQTQQQTRVDLSYILDFWNAHYDPEEEEEMKVVVTTNGLLEVRNLPMSQANRLLERAKEYHAGPSPSEGWGINTACRALIRINRKLDALLASQDQIVLWQRELLDFLRRKGEKDRSQAEGSIVPQIDSPKAPSSPKAANGVTPLSPKVAGNAPTPLSPKVAGNAPTPLSPKAGPNEHVEMGEVALDVNLFDEDRPKSHR